MTDHPLARGSVDGQPVHVGDEVIIKAKVLQSREGVGVLLDLFSKTDQYPAWVREDHVLYASVDDALPTEPADGTWRCVRDSNGNGKSLIFHRDDADGYHDRPERRHDRHWWDVVAQEWIDWPTAVQRGAAQVGYRQMVVLDAEATDVDLPNLDAAMHACWLYGNWEQMTKRMSMPEREAAAAAVERYGERIDPDDRPGISGLRWWR